MESVGGEGGREKGEGGEWRVGGGGGGGMLED